MAPPTTPPSVPSAAEAVAHLETVTNEMKRLMEHFGQRSRDEKKRMSQLEALRPKLKRLSKRAAPRPVPAGEKADSITADEQALLESLAPKPKG